MKDMPIIGFNINKIDARKDNDITGQLEIKSDLKITKVEEQTILLGNDKKALKFNFDFIVDYEPKYAKIVLSGDIMFMEDEGKAKDIIEKWKKTKKLEPELAERLFNNILLKCNIKTLNLSQDLNLPPHIRLPIIVSNAQKETKEIKDKKSSYIG